ncbi:MAG: hypothetical protein K0S09_1175 [Sphingobacteriaceae bacterium]|jgi:hypothetical protein|nr:hypothetical protein [Sphingobacteriaceae bacterium]
MKAKILILLIAAGLGSGSAVAQTKSCEPIIQNFIESHINSDAKALNKILSSEAVYKVPKQANLRVQSRTDVISAMQRVSGTKQNCTGTFQVLGNTEAFVLARVDFKYPEFTQQNFLTIERNDGSDWKITMVCKAFIDDATAKPANVSTVY